MTMFDHEGGGGVKISENLTTWYMDGPLDILMEEFKLNHDFSELSMFDMLDSDCLDRKDILSPIIIFLEKLYFLNFDILYENYGTTLRHLLEFGKFQISPYLANPYLGGELLYNGYRKDELRNLVSEPQHCPSSK